MSFWDEVTAKRIVVFAKQIKRIRRSDTAESALPASFPISFVYNDGNAIVVDK